LIHINTPTDEYGVSSIDAAKIFTACFRGVARVIKKYCIPIIIGNAIFL